VKTAKYLMIAAVLGFVGLTAGLVVAVLYIDRIARVGMETGATYALGVRTTVADVSVGLRAGKIGIDVVNVDNPVGYQSPHFMRLARGNAEVTLPSLMSELVEMPELTLSGIDMNLERRGRKSNYKIILENIKKFESRVEEIKPRTDSEKKYVIRRVNFEDVSVVVELLPVGGDLTRIPIHIDRIELRDVGSHQTKGVVLSELTHILVKALIEAVIRRAGDLLPRDVMSELAAGLKGLDEIHASSLEIVGEVRATVEGRTRILKEIGRGVVEELGIGREAGKRTTGASPPQ
jgi:hypothetical protein